ncbi:hypothetical protein [Marinobacter salicampi]|uniref:hypothetical protein n=1 Tax=Marinobacter salicampi TaxID=435907 RepID=UPI00140A9761|nr:hypothetical protein [Marinobacter salicampi]
MSACELEPVISDHGQKADQNNDLHPGDDIKAWNDHLGAQIVENDKGEAKIENQILAFQGLPEFFEITF